MQTQPDILWHLHKHGSTFAWVAHHLLSPRPLDVVVALNKVLFCHLQRECMHDYLGLLPCIACVAPHADGSLWPLLC